MMNMRRMESLSESKESTAMGEMVLKKIEHKLSVCKVGEISDINLSADFFFVGKTDEEVSLVCKTEDAPIKTMERDDGWRG